MGEGFEILLWLALMAILGMRGAARNRKRAEREAAEEPEPLAGGAAPDRIGSDGGAASATRERPAGGRGGLFDRMAEYAAELERQAREQQAEAEARVRQAEAPPAHARARTDMRAAARRRGGERGEDGAGTVVVPGRRVRPTPLAERASATVVRPPGDEALIEPLQVLEVADSDHSRRPRRFEAARLTGGDLSRRARAPIGAAPEGPVRRPRRPGLARLDRYPTLKRAMVLSEVLGRPPGLDGVAPVERHWSGD